MTNQKDITEDDVINGLKNKEFFLAFQPIMNLKSDSFETFESFVRWQHPVYGELAPADFMIIVQKYKLTEGLTKQIIECAVKQIQNNYNAGYGETGVNINLSIQEFLNPHTLYQISEAVKHIPNPEFLGLEISPRILTMYFESNPNDEEYHPDCVPSDREKDFLLDIKNTCDKYSALGVTLALDTTDNIIGSLIRADILGLHALKMSTRSLQSSITNEEGTLSEYAQAAKDFCIPIIAMGIEEAELFQKIYTNHIIYAQGNFFCGPLVLDNPEKFKNNLDNYYLTKNSLMDVQQSRTDLKALSKTLLDEKNSFKDNLSSLHNIPSETVISVIQDNNFNNDLNNNDLNNKRASFSCPTCLSDLGICDCKVTYTKIPETSKEFFETLNKQESQEVTETPSFTFKTGFNSDGNSVLFGKKKF